MVKHLMSIAAAVVAATLLTASSCEFVDKLWKKAEVVEVEATPAAEEAKPVEAPAMEATEQEAPMVHDHEEK
jgi:3-methyladenine DNA glycosylase Mpg